MTPDEEVAQRIIDAFRKSELLSEENIKKLDQGLATGKLTAEDWRLYFGAYCTVKEIDGADKD